jgi:hypothetical protein
LKALVDQYPKEAVVVAASVAFGVGTLWRRGYL